MICQEDMTINIDESENNTKIDDSINCIEYNTEDLVEWEVP